MNLFLDDIRNPLDCGYTMNPIYKDLEWSIVRSYEEFVAFIEENGLPELISFDHYLADSHYIPKKYWYDYDASNAYQECITHKEKNGNECAKWLVDYCLNNGLPLPSYLCHSMNPVGKYNILNTLEKYYKYKLDYERTI